MVFVGIVLDIVLYFILGATLGFAGVSPSEKPIEFLLILIVVLLIDHRKNIFN